MNKHYVYIIIAASLWGTIGIIVKNFYAAGFSPIQLVTFRTLIGASCIFVYLALRDREKLKISFRDWWLFIGTGIISFVFFNICYFISVERNGLSVASVLLYTAPAFVFLLSVMIFKESVTKIKIFALVLALTGCTFVSGALEGSGGSMDLYGIFAGILAGFGYGLYSIFAKLALKKYDTVTVTFYTFLFGAIGALPFARMGEVPGMITSGAVAMNIVLLAVIITILPFTLYTKGLSGVEPSKASILATIEPIVATIFGVVLFQEEMTLLKISGILLVIGAAIMINLTSQTSRGEIHEP